MERFGVRVDESYWVGGDYGPYVQSERRDIYQAIAKNLVMRGAAYPCFLTEAEISEIRAQQEAMGILPGIYGEYSLWRDAPLENVREAIAAGKTWVLRFRCPNRRPDARIATRDEIRGKFEAGDNFLDVPLLKTDGMPTYHFAHVVDDHFMRTTHVVRAEEWLPSLPLHLQLFEACEWEPPKYAHTAQLMKTQDGNKRKLSKRHDPEANVEYFFERGYPVEAIKDYLFNVIDSGYEPWRVANPHANREEYVFEFAKMPRSGALFDLKKLDSVSHGIISELSNDELFDRMLEWAEYYDASLHGLMVRHRDLAKAAVSIQRLTDKDPKKFRTFSDTREYLCAFLPELFAERKMARAEMESPLDATLSRDILSDYLSALDTLPTDPEGWLASVRERSKKFGMAQTNAEWKEGGFAGRFSDYAMTLRLAIAASAASADLFETMRVLGADETRTRLTDRIAELS
jgi:glutamyl-tRNA synthetase